MSLLTGKRAYVFAARGGNYVGMLLDTQAPYVLQFLRFLGITEVEVVYPEGLAVSEASKAGALAHPKMAIERLEKEHLAAA